KRIFPGEGLSAIAYHSSQNSQHGTVGHQLPFIEGFASPNGSKQFFMLGFVRVVLFALIFPSIRTVNFVDTSPNIHQATSFRTGNFHPIAVGASLLLTAKVETFGTVGKVVLNGKVIPYVAVNSIRSGLTSTRSS